LGAFGVGHPQARQSRRPLPRRERMSAQDDVLRQPRPIRLLLLSLAQSADQSTFFETIKDCFQAVCCETSCCAKGFKCAAQGKCEKLATADFLFWLFFQCTVEHYSKISTYVLCDLEFFCSLKGGYPDQPFEHYCTLSSTFALLSARAKPGGLQNTVYIVYHS
jgi:hypothetical protein